MYSTTHYPACYDSWFASEDKDGTYYIMDPEDNSYHTTQFGTNHPSNHCTATLPVFLLVYLPLNPSLVNHQQIANRQLCLLSQPQYQNQNSTSTWQISFMFQISLGTDGEYCALSAKTGVKLVFILAYLYGPLANSSHSLTTEAAKSMLQLLQKSEVRHLKKPDIIYSVNQFHAFKKHADQINELKLQACNDSHKYIHALTQLDDYNCLLMAISHNDIPRIHQIVNIAMCNGASV
ncbi:hypothetical protein BDR07DRAFT_1380569 [Suillus spraguei]|nr:hypothetical protein BDR07DRAFT_1380569 [Suillus spraguei]